MKQPVLYQRIEGGIVFLAALYFYFELNNSVIVLLLSILAIDIFMIGYLTKSNRIGAHIYNLGHSIIFPPLVLVLGSLTNTPWLFGLGLIWLAHIGMDRMMGFGLKFDTDFKDTHLGKIKSK